MNLYLIKRDDLNDTICHDEFVGHVIAAHDEKTARSIAADKEKVNVYLQWTWLTPEEEGLRYPFFSTVTTLATDVSLIEGIVLSEG